MSSRGQGDKGSNHCISTYLSTDLYDTVAQYSDVYGLKLKLNGHYLVNFCIHANDLYRFGFAVTLSKRAARQCVVTCSASFLAKILNSGHSSEDRIQLISQCWKAFQEVCRQQSDHSRLTELWAGMSLEERACLAIRGLWSLTDSEIATSLQLSVVDVRSHLHAAQEHLRANAGRRGRSDLKTGLRAYGLLKNCMFELNLSESDLESIRKKLGAGEILLKRAEQRVKRIKGARMVLRIAYIGALIAVPTLCISMLFGPKFHEMAQPIRPLQELVGETYLLAEEGLSFPNSDQAEISDFFEQAPGLTFQPLVFVAPLGEGWQLEGAEILAHEEIKVAAVGYENTARTEHLYLFSYPGKLSELPPAYPVHLKSGVFQIYLCKNINIIAWQSTEQTVAMFVGHLSPYDLSKLVIRGLARVGF